MNIAIAIEAELPSISQSFISFVVLPMGIPHSGKPVAERCPCVRGSAGAAGRLVAELALLVAEQQCPCVRGGAGAAELRRVLAVLGAEPKSRGHGVVTVFLLSCCRV